MPHLKKPAFDVAAFLAKAGLGRKIVQLDPKETFCLQGHPANAIFYLQKGPRKTHRRFEEWERGHHHASLRRRLRWGGVARKRGWTTSGHCYHHPCTALKVEREDMIRIMHQEHAFSDLFLKVLLARSMRTQADLVDRLFIPARNAWHEFCC